MGKKKAEALRRRVGHQREQNRQQRKSRSAEIQRASRLKLDASSLESAFNARGDKGAELVGGLAMARHVARFKWCETRPELLPPEAWSALAIVPICDIVLTEAGRGWPTGPDMMNRLNWPHQVLWGVDQAVEACRHLRMGNVIGAITIARAQIERWSANVAHHHEIDRREGEETKDYFNRVWSTYPWLRDFALGDTWANLSEWIHGREGIAQALEFGTTPAIPSPDRSGLPETTTSIIKRTATALEVVFRQVRGATSVIAQESGQEKYNHLLQLSPRIDEQPYIDLNFKNLAPLDLAFSTGRVGHAVEQRAETYRAVLQLEEIKDALSKTPNWLLAADSVTERRGRATAFAREAFIHEAEQLGEDFAPHVLHARLFQYIAISEIAEISATWLTGPERDALMLAANALRSAWIMWLEDTDNSLACMRIVLEQACRARAWRRNAHRAARTEAGRGTPTRWVEAAGWGRLSLLTRALGEFSHINSRIRWSGARDALAALLREGERYPELIARGHALDASALLLAHEVVTRLEQRAPSVAAAFREGVTLLEAEDHDSQVEGLLERALAARGLTFGEPDLVEVATNGLDTSTRRQWLPHLFD
ncbi:hypothetical protein [Micromonospora haikouensis]|nr:hypothetical protein [Micromonospora haikouensis]